MKKPIVILSEIHHGQTIEVDQDQKVVIQLQEHSGSGYLWIREPTNEAVINVVDDGFVPDDEHSDCVPQGGKYVTSLTFKRSGIADLTLNELRPFENDKAPISTFHITFMVNIVL